ncbi:unnamed protein product [Pedinophyceae sp. YPF-701]|nr:unnamed protein product [Pedinophyceae sp. YPF-701]
MDVAHAARAEGCGVHALRHRRHPVRSIFAPLPRKAPVTRAERPAGACLHSFKRAPGAHSCPRGLVRRGRCIRASATADRASEPSELLRLQAWINEFGEQPAKLTPSTLPGANRGWGLVADESLSQGQLLLRVPKWAMMTAESGAASAHCGALIDAANLSEWQALCLHLLCECAAGEHSRWAAYLAALPPRDSDWHPLLWPDERVELIRGSFMSETLQRRVAEVLSDVEVLVSAGANELLVAGHLSEPLVTERSMRWAAAVLLSRAFSLSFERDEFDVDDDDDDNAIILQDPQAAEPEALDVEDFDRSGCDGFLEPPVDASFLDDSFSDEMPGRWDAPAPALALVPWADMLNHSSDAGQSSVLRFNHGTQQATLRAHRDYSPGEEVFDSYGPQKSPSELLMDYGFVDAANRNFWVEVPLAVLARPAGAAAQALFEVALLGDFGAVLDDAGPDQAILSWVRAATGTDGELAELGWDPAGGAMGDAMAVVWELEEPAPREWEARMYDHLIETLDTQLAKYPASLEEDQARLATAQLNEGSAVECSIRLALMSEKIALRGSLERLMEARKRL